MIRIAFRKPSPSGADSIMSPLLYPLCYGPETSDSNTFGAASLGGDAGERLEMRRANLSATAVSRACDWADVVRRARRR